MQNTPCQDKAIQFIKEFILDDTRTECIISGQGGVGKTYILNQIYPIITELMETLDTINEKLPYTTVKKAATTNKAASLIEGVTLESMFGYHLKKDYKTGKTYLSRSKPGSKAVVANSIICVDESSMISESLMKMYQEDAVNCKFIYFMDHAQLGPVKSKEIPVMTLGLDQQDMLTPVRQGSTSDLYKECVALREAVLNQQTHFPQINEDIKYISEKACEKYIVAADGINHKILTYRNETAEAYNAANRVAQGRKSNYEVGEYFISNGIYCPNNKIILKNEQMVKVDHVDDRILTSEATAEVPYITLIVSIVDPNTLEEKFGQASINVPVDPIFRRKEQTRLFRAKNYRYAFGLQDGLADLRNVAASTIHKSQGSTFDTVMIDIQDLIQVSNYDIDMYRRLLFVAVSRARKKVYLFDRYYC